MQQPAPDTLPSVRDLASPEGLRDPYAVYSRFRDAEAAGHDIGRIVVRYDQVVGLLADRRLSSARVRGILEPLGAEVRERCPLVGRTLQGIVAFRDPPDHTRIRRLLASTFSLRMVKRVSEMIERISTRLLDSVAARGEADLHRAYTYPLPAMVVGAMLGVPEADLDRFKWWAQDIVFLVGSGSPSERLALAAEGLLGLAGAVAIVLGANIGTCATALAASVGTSAEAKRVSIAHIAFKVLGAALVFPLIGPFTSVVAASASDPARQIANARVIQNSRNLAKRAAVVCKV